MAKTYEQAVNEFPAKGSVNTEAGATALLNQMIECGDPSCLYEGGYCLDTTTHKSLRSVLFDTWADWVNADIEAGVVMDRLKCIVAGTYQLAID